jgi:hypothetical protein
MSDDKVVHFNSVPERKGPLEMTRPRWRIILKGMLRN